MELQIDEDVKRVLEFMQESMDAGRLVAVAAGVCVLAPILWGGYDPVQIEPLRLVHPPISADDPRTRSVANE
jgi:hypothetical protein